MLEKIKEFLNKYKIFTEVFSNIFLGIMGMVISINAINVAKYQNILVKRELLPVLEIIEYQSPNEEDIYNETLIQISNIGGALYGLKTDRMCFLNIEYQTEDGREGKTKKEIIGYYSYSKSTNRANGLLQTISGYNNWNKYINIKNSITDEKLKVYGIKFLNIRIEKYLKLQYYDVFNEKHIDYYKIEHDLERIEDTEYESVKDYAQSSDCFDIDMDSSEKILEMVSYEINK